MKIHSYLLSLFCFFLVSSNCLFAQSRSSAYSTYIDQYSDLAIKHMEKYKIPASITLAQGILESGAGKSELAREGNNHFGIKCHSDWTGDRVHREDDGPNDCFRSYKNANDSFEDHARFLTERSRYAVLFTLDIKDYKAWAKGLQNCGYATNKAYANRLIQLIEEHELYKYDTKKGIKYEKQSTPNISPSHSYNKQNNHRDIYKAHNLIYVLANTDDSFESIARDLGFNVKDLLQYNEVHDGFPLNQGDIVYLEKKKKKADKPHFEHVIQIGESMHSISQQYGIQLSRLYKINKKNNDYTPEEGHVLKLR